MSLDPFTALAGLVTGIQGFLAVAILLAVGRTAVDSRRRGAAGPPVGRDPVSLLAGPATVLVGLSLAAWPLLYLLLQSYVPLWSGVMCIQGVLRIGTGSPGPAGWLPGLLGALQVTKPALLFVAGAWLVLHRVNRGTRTAPLAPRVLGALAVLGLLAFADAALEALYLAIPKREQALALGCCTFSLPSEAGGVFRRLLSAVAPPDRALLLTVAGGALGALVVGGTLLGLRRLRAKGLGLVLPLGLTLAAALSIPLGLAYLSEVAAPALLDQPDHRCAWCLLAQVPLSALAVVLLLLGAFAWGWAATLLALGRHAQTREIVGSSVRWLLILSLVGYVGAGLLAAIGAATA